MSVAVQTTDVQRVRGSLGTHDQGLIMSGIGVGPAQDIWWQVDEAK
jgi:hypothetical protein